MSSKPLLKTFYLHSDLLNVHKMRKFSPIGELIIIKEKRENEIDKEKIKILKTEVNNFIYFTSLCFKNFKLSKELMKTLIGVKPILIRCEGCNVENSIAETVEMLRIANAQVGWRDPLDLLNYNENSVLEIIINDFFGLGLIKVLNLFYSKVKNSGNLKLENLIKKPNLKLFFKIYLKELILFNIQISDKDVSELINSLKFAKQLKILSILFT